MTLAPSSLDSVVNKQTGENGMIITKISFVGVLKKRLNTVSKCSEFKISVSLTYLKGKILTERKFGGFG